MDRKTAKESLHIRDWLEKAGHNAEWDFILVGTDYDDVVENRVPEEARTTGNSLTPRPSLDARARVRTFAAGEMFSTRTGAVSPSY
jgi:hypothetical protein